MSEITDEQILDALFVSEEVSYTMTLTRLVDGIRTYSVQFPDSEARYFSDDDEGCDEGAQQAAYEYIRKARHDIKLAAIRKLLAPIEAKVETARDALLTISALGNVLRQGGPDMDDLHDLSENLDTATDVAMEALDELAA